MGHSILGGGRCVEVEDYPPVPLGNLCSRCKGIFDTQPDLFSLSDQGHGQSPYYRHHGTESSLADAATAGCPLCQRLLVGFRGTRVVDKNGERKVSLTNGLCYRVYLYYLERITITFSAGSLLEQMGRYQPSMPIGLDPVALSITPLDDKGSPEDLENTSTGSTRSLQLAKYWLKTCEQNHTECHHPVASPDEMPTRLIRIRKVEGEFQTHLVYRTVYLEDAGGERSLVRYATLSHRWGTDDIFSLVGPNSEELYNNIPMPKLGKVFQDAIAATWALGLGYLWVDSLCILQDSLSEWAAESYRMGAIYKNATCNLAAASFENNDKGMFLERSPFVHFSPHIFLDWSDVILDEKTVSLRGYYTIRDSANWGTSVNIAPLNQRGWVTQERELSPCTLTFSRHQIYWRCGELEACESFPNGIPGRENRNMSINTMSFKSLGEERDTKVVIRFWHNFVDGYSTTELTHSRDKLAAASGMARELSRLMPDNRYLSGLWESNLVEDLLWRVFLPDPKISEGNTRLASIADSRVPSWSWASLDCDVHCGGPDTWGPNAIATVTAREFVTPVLNEESLNPFVACSRLQISAPLVRLLDVLQIGGSGNLYIYPDFSEKLTFILGTTCVLPTFQEGPGTRTKQEQRSLTSATLFLPMAHVGHVDILMGLLINTTGHKDRSFVRAGYFEAWCEDEEHVQDILRHKADLGDVIDQVECIDDIYSVTLI
jgi:hypothetical protein